MAELPEERVLELLRDPIVDVVADEVGREAGVEAHGWGECKRGCREATLQQRLPAVLRARRASDSPPTPGDRRVKDRSLVRTEHIDSAILAIRGHRVMLDVDLAKLYGVETKALIRAVRRNAERFPADFMFQMSEEEFTNLRYQFGTSSSWGGRRYRPYAFTEHGVAMLSSVLRSATAAQVNIEIMRAFVRTRQMLQPNLELAGKLDALEKKYDSQFRAVFDAIRELMEPPNKPTKRIGFRSERS